MKNRENILALEKTIPKFPDIKEEFYKDNILDGINHVIDLMTYIRRDYKDYYIYIPIRIKQVVSERNMDIFQEERDNAKKIISFEAGRAYSSFVFDEDSDSNVGVIKINK